MSARILCVQFASIGDLILTTPALSALHSACPDAHIALLTSTQAEPVVRGVGLVDEVIALDKALFNGTRAFLTPANWRRLRAFGRFDTVIYFHHFTLKAGTLKFWLIARAVGARRRVGLQNGNGWFLTDSIADGGFGARHQAEYWLDLVALLGADSAPRPARVARQTFDLPPAESDAPTVVIHAGSGGYSLARRWDAAGFAAVADALASDGARVVLVGSADDDSAAVQARLNHPVIDLTGRTTLAELADVLANADLFIGADSGVLHLAAASGSPVLAIFGPSNHRAWGAWNPAGRVVTVRSAPVCSPCSYVEHQIGLRDGCAARTCMRMVTPERVIALARRLLKGEDVTTTHDDQPPVTRDWPRIRVLGLPVDGITYDRWFDLIDGWKRDGGRGRQVCTTNPEFIMIAQDDVNFANILKRADLCVPDGVGLLWAARRLGQPLPERVTGSDGVPRIAEQAAKRGWKLFFLGAAEGVAQAAADILRERYPELQIVGVHSGSPAPEEEDAIAAMVNASGADMLFVAYGAPNQDKWIARNLPRLRVCMAMGVGGSFDFIAGTVPRAPVWMQRLGLEWLFRLIRQPWRIRRMMRLPRFVWAVLRRGAS